MVRRPAVCRPAHQPARAEQEREYDARRGSATERGYDARWRKARLVHLAEYPLCVMCQARGEIRAATVVDHIVPHRGDPVLFWDPSNWQSLCQPDHDRHKQALEAATRGVGKPQPPTPVDR